MVLMRFQLLSTDYFQKACKMIKEKLDKFSNKRAYVINMHYSISFTALLLDMKVAPMYFLTCSDDVSYLIRIYLFLGKTWVGLERFKYVLLRITHSF